MKSSLMLALFISGAVAVSASAENAKPKQAVLISFDGAHDNAHWKRSLALGETTGAKFTYFLSCVYLLAPENKGRYIPPAPAPGRSNVGFGKSKADVSARLNNIWWAHVSGHDIANHGCGHFDGKAWTDKDWAREFQAFNEVVANAWAINGEREPFGWRAAANRFSNGFRAPYLSTGNGLETALEAAGFAYDASSVSRGISNVATKKGIARFALPTLPEGPEGRRIISMDYNLFIRHSGGFERTDSDGAFEQRTYDMLMAAFKEQYGGQRLPVQFGLHFTLMNGGAYWRALERFVGDVCKKPDVACISYADYMKQAEPEAAEKTALRPAISALSSQ